MARSTAPFGHEVGDLVAARLRDVPDFPQAGVVFKDISPLLADPDAFGVVIDAFAAVARACGPVDLVAGIEARGFILAAALAERLGCGMVPVRKAGKLPPPTVHASYDLEYGSATIEVPLGLIDGRRVYLIDDVLATGGTMSAAADLIERAGGDLVGLGVLIELAFLGGRARVAPREITALLTLD